MTPSPDAVDQSESIISDSPPADLQYCGECGIPRHIHDHPQFIGDHKWVASKNPRAPRSYSCLRCGHHWTPKDQSRPPRCCSLCRSAYWDSPAAGEMTADARVAAQARIREKVAQRAVLARRKTAERKLVRWASIVGPDAVNLVLALFPSLDGVIARPDTPTEQLSTPIWDGRLWMEDRGSSTTVSAPMGMPPPPKFEKDE
jgi:hypothetical protein